MVRKAKKNYINNEDLHAALTLYGIRCREAEAQGKQIPQVTDYIGKCFMQIATNLARSRSFSNYPFREEMEMDGVINCLKYIRNFDPEKFDKPFAYFTQIIRNTFLTRIAEEKKQLYVVFKSSQELLALGETYAGVDEVRLNLTTSADYINDYIEEYETKMSEKKERAREKAKIVAAEKASLVTVLDMDEDEPELGLTEFLDEE